MQDKSFEDAIRELSNRLTAEIQEHVHNRVHGITGNTISSLVTDIERTQMRAAVTDILCLVKVIAHLQLLHGFNRLIESYHF